MPSAGEKRETGAPSIKRGPESPSAERIARRVLALTALTARASLDKDPPNPDERFLDKILHRNFLDWIKKIGIESEFEPQEWAIIQSPPGQLERQAMIDSIWRLEGLAVLGWALQLCDIPAHDELVYMNDLWKKLGLEEVDTALELMAHPRLRPAQELCTLRERMFAFHWRMRSFSLRHDTMDFAETARTAWWGPILARLRSAERLPLSLTFNRC